MTSNDPRYTLGTPRDLSSERDYLESLSNERFNFLLLFYSLVVAGAFQTDQQYVLSAILSVGALICTMLALPIARAQFKLDLVLDEMAQSCKSDPAMRTVDWEKEPERLNRIVVPWYARRFAKKGRRRMIGYLIPTVCYVTLWIGAVAGWSGLLTPQAHPNKALHQTAQTP